MSEQTPEAAFAAALVEFQKQLPRVGKGQTATVPTKSGGNYSYSYADLTAVSDAALPLLAEHGLAWTARPALVDGRFVLACSLLHVGGHREEGAYPLPDPANNTPQQIGSAITYARRYALTALTGIAPSGEDDDGKHASTARQPDPVAADPQQRAWNEVATVAKRLGWTPEKVAEDYAEWSQGQFLADADAATLTQYRDYLDEERKKGQREAKQLEASTLDTTQNGRMRKDSSDQGRVERSKTAPADEWAAEPAAP